MTMNREDSIVWKEPREKGLSRRSLIRVGASAVVGAGLLRSKKAFADDDGEHAACALANPIPGGVTPFKPFGVVVHHNPLSPANRLAVANINDPSQITDFDGFVGLTHIRGGGMRECRGSRGSLRMPSAWNASRVLAPVAESVPTHRQGPLEYRTAGRRVPRSFPKVGVVLLV